MATDDRLNETVTRWLEETAPDRLPERVLDSTFERTRRSRQEVGWRALLGRFHVRRSVFALGAAAVIVMAAVVTLEIGGFFSGVGAPVLVPATHAGDWMTTDDPPDSSNMTMAVVALPDGTYEVTVHDDSAAVCGGTSSTMTGVAQSAGPGTIVVAQPVYVCDDGREAQALGGPPLAEQLRDLALIYSVQDDVIDSGGLVWTRADAGAGGEPAVERTPTPASSEVPGSSAALAGSWEATDGPADTSHLTMDIAERSDGSYDVTILDDDASVCNGASSTMTGVAEETAPGTIVIERPMYRCDDGSQAESLSGPPLDEQLANLTIDHVAQDALGDSLGLIWERVAPD